MTSSSSGRRAGRARSPREAAFTLLELVVALVLFAFIVVEVLADREDSIRMSADARILQTIRYLGGTKLDEIRHDPDRYGENESGDFSDLNENGELPNLADYTWELEMKRLVAVGGSDEADAEFLFPEDEESDPLDSGDGGVVPPRYVRRMTLVIRFEPEGQSRPELSAKIVTYLPPTKEDEEETQGGGN